MKKVLNLKGVKYIFLITTIIWFAYGYSHASGNGDRGRVYSSKFKQDPSLNYHDLDRTFQLKFDYYKANLNELQKVQKWMVVIIIISLLILIFGVDKIPFFGFTIPDNLIYIVIYFGGIYLWVNFGLTFNTAIDDRLTLNSYIDLLEYNQGLSHENNIKHILLDNSILDNWFGWYFGIFENSHHVNTPFQFLGIYFIYAIILGLYAFCLVVSTFEFAKRKVINKYLYFTLVTFILLMLIMSTFSFIADQKSYSAFWMASIWLFATFGLFYWDFYGEKIYKKNRIVRKKPWKNEDKPQ